MVGLAERIYREQLERGDLAADQRVDMQLKLAAALIAQQDFGALRLVLTAIPEAYRQDRYALYQAVGIYGSGADVDVQALRQALKGCEPGNWMHRSDPGICCWMACWQTWRDGRMYSKWLFAVRRRLRCRPSSGHFQEFGHA